jgi:signal transduction histidine kinase/CheY-like chemotaxis protein
MPALVSSFSRAMLAPFSVLLSATVVIGAGLLATVYDTQFYQSQKMREVQVQAEILANSVVAALAFDDREAALQYVMALQANPEVSAAAVYSLDNAVFASYVRDEAPLPLQPYTGGARFADGNLETSVPVVQNDRLLGRVYLRELGEPLSRRVLRYGGIILLLAMGSLVFAVLLSARRELAAKNEELQLRNASLLEQIDAREKVEEALRQSQKMEAVGQLTGGIAHDFNNMLAVIIGALELLKRRAARGDANLSELADAALDGAQRAASLTQRLLAFSRQQALRPEPVDVNKLVSGLSELLRRTLGENIRIETVLAAGMWRTSVDPHQLENALLNLAVNSRDAMPEGGRLTIETGNSQLDDHYAREAGVAAGQYVMVAVTDTGAGMKPEVVAKAFDPFFTTKGIGKGTGLGLSQVYGFVRQSGGHVKIYSESGQGTCIKIYLPRFVGEIEAPATATREAIVPETNGTCVLVVEDEESVRNFAVAALKEIGYRVLAAADAAGGIAQLRQHPEVAILFTDVVMPDANGRQLADEALKLRPHLRVLFTTGYTKNAVVHNGVLDHGVHLLSKPFTIEQLSMALRKAQDS